MRCSLAPLRPGLPGAGGGEWGASARRCSESSAITPADVRTSVRRLRAWQPPHLDRYAVDGAWDLQDRHGLSYWNALIVSSALQQSCTHLLSLELAALVADGEIEGIRLVSPLAMKPEELE
jgi:predicted nucleic acid-binding protein